MREFAIGPNDAGQRADKFIFKVTQNLPPSLLYKAFRKKRVKLSGGRCRPETILSPGDVLSLYLNDEFFPALSSSVSPPPAVPLDILYEDENILLLHKEAGLVVHADNRNSTDTLINRLHTYLQSTGAYAPAREQSFAPALCNRLDRYTSGIVIAAKNAPALRAMSEQIRLRNVEKRYLCVTLGALNPPQGEHHAYLKKREQGNQVEVRGESAPGFHPIATRWKTLSRRDELALLEVELLTGRTHQIRAHLAFLGHPLLGDNKYGNPAVNRRHSCQNQLLCAHSVHFAFPSDTPVLGTLSGRTFTVPAPFTL